MVRCSSFQSEFCRSTFILRDQNAPKHRCAIARQPRELHPKRMFDEVYIIGVEPRLEVLGMKHAMPAHPISFPRSNPMDCSGPRDATFKAGPSKAHHWRIHGASLPRPGLHGESQRYRPRVAASDGHPIPRRAGQAPNASLFGDCLDLTVRSAAMCRDRPRENVTVELGHVLEHDHVALTHERFGDKLGRVTFCGLEIWVSRDGRNHTSRDDAGVRGSPSPAKRVEGRTLARLFRRGGDAASVIMGPARRPALAEQRCSRAPIARCCAVFAS